MPKPVTSSAKKPAAKRATAARSRTRDVVPAEVAHSAQREHAARWLAIGLTQQATADKVGVGLRTVQRWVNEDEGFLDRIEELRSLTFEHLEQRFSALLEHAVEVHHQVLNGEVAHDASAAIVADKLLTRFVEKLFEPSAATATAAAPVGSQVNVYTGGEPERPSRRIDGYAAG